MAGQGPIVFISAVTSELGGVRETLAKICCEHGADPRVQRDFPSRLSDGRAIQKTIDDADVAIFLIGYRYGMELPEGNRPPEARPGCSWTQWEYWYARAHAKERRLFFYTGPAIAPTEAQPFADRQAAFRDEVQKIESGLFGGLFFSFFDSPDKVAADITKYLENPDGELETFQAATWHRIKSEYRAASIDAWQKDFPACYTEADRASPERRQALMRASKPPFITSQGFQILVPGTHDEQSQFLKPAGFLPGRESETQASARAGSEWRPVAREQIVEALRHSTDPDWRLADVALPQPRRLFLISGGGVGKTTNMRWLEAALNGLVTTSTPANPAESTEVFAVMIAAEKLVGAHETHIVAALADKIAHEVNREADSWSRNSITKGLVSDLGKGRLVILIDGLDHIEAERIRILVSIQSRIAAHYWVSCAIVIAGRPHALLGWEDAPVNTQRTVSLGAWRFLEPAEFGPDEAEVFLGATEGEKRYELVEDKLGTLIRVPRVLEYVRTLPRRQLADVRTSADIYEKATRQLVRRTLQEGGETAREIGPDWERDRARRDVPRPEQIDYVMKVLSALAFLALCPTSDLAFRVPRKSLLLMVDAHVKDQLWARVAPQDPIAGSESPNLVRDLHALATFAAIVGNGLLEATDADAETLQSVEWSNRTIGQFLAAYWLARHARGAEALRDRLAGRPESYETDDLHRDTDRLRCYLFYPEADYLDGSYEKTDVTYELNQFLAEMPATAISAESWVAAASAWYDPDPCAELGEEAPPRTWSAEMLYRSWPAMIDLARRPFDDWWDLPYDKLSKVKPGPARAQASLHAERQSPQGTAQAANIASTVVKRFLSDFESILNGARGRQLQAVAKEMIAEENWIAVPAGTFAMGAPPEKQGFPSKVKAYWLQNLDDVQTGKLTATEAAERSTKVEWFTGAQGSRLREGDIYWLTCTYGSVAPQSCAPRPSTPNRTAPEYEQALRALESRWSRKDETPVEKVQEVGGFVMHRYPILHRWFWLFSPGHRDTVESYLGTGHPADDHPAIYISWYDAWAFCQWATWTEEDANAPKGRRRYGLRLPHEPEWEYASRWARQDSGAAQQTPFGQRYWWGDHFYREENAPTEEALSEDVAHAIGHPGKTRAPHQAAPNGLGFYDILGNVWEWTANLYDPRKERVTAGMDEMHYSRMAPTTRPPINCSRTMRGGLWYYLDVLANCSSRFRLECDDRDYKMGFRVVREERP